MLYTTKELINNKIELLIIIKAMTGHLNQEERNEYFDCFIKQLKDEQIKH